MSRDRALRLAVPFSAGGSYLLSQGGGGRRGKGEEKQSVGERVAVEAGAERTSFEVLLQAAFERVERREKGGGGGERERGFIGRWASHCRVTEGRAIVAWLLSDCC